MIIINNYIVQWCKQWHDIFAAAAEIMNETIILSTLIFYIILIICDTMTLCLDRFNVFSCWCYYMYDYGNKHIVWNKLIGMMYNGICNALLYNDIM